MEPLIADKKCCACPDTFLATSLSSSHHLLLLLHNAVSLIDRRRMMVTVAETVTVTVTRMKCLLVISALCLLSLDFCEAACPNLCNNNGLCGINNVCICHEGFTGADCSRRK